MKKSYDAPLFLLLSLRANDICEISDFVDVDGELGDYDEGLTPDGDDL